MVKGVFSEWQPHYAERRIATFPVNADKKPAIRRWNQITLKGSTRLAERFHEANAFGFQLGPKSQITALDIDSQSEAILADALTCHGNTPFIVRTGGGYHAYYSHAGERRLIRPYNDKPVDILGGGFVVAPPSVSQKGPYQQARHSDTCDDLLDVMRTRNMDCEPLLRDDVIIATAKSAWRYEQEGTNLVGRGRSVVTPHAVIDVLIGESQDAFILLTLLQRHHWGRNFVLANAMADQLGWSRKRFAATRALLESLGFIKLVAPANFQFPASYRLGAWGGRI